MNSNVVNNADVINLVNNSSGSNLVPELLNEPILINNFNNSNNSVNINHEEPVNVNNIPNELQPEPFMNIEPFDNMEASFSRF